MVTSKTEIFSPNNHNSLLYNFISINFQAFIQILTSILTLDYIFAKVATQKLF